MKPLFFFFKTIEVALSGQKVLLKLHFVNFFND